MAVDPELRFKKKYNPVKGFSDARKKRLEEEEITRQEKALKTKTTQQAAEKKKQDEKSIVQKGAEAVGGFVGDVAKDIYDTTKNTIDNTVKTVKSVGANADLERVTELRNQRNREWAERFGNADEEQWKDPEFQRKSREFLEESDKKIKLGKDTQKDLDAFQDIDAKKAAFEAGETALNVGTLGAVGTVKAVGKQAGKNVVKQVLKQSLKTGGTEAFEQVIKAGGEKMAKQAAQEALQSGRKKLAKNVAEGAMLGSGYGATQTGKRDPDADLDDYLVNVAFGAGAGMAIPVAGVGIKKGYQKGKEALAGTPKAPVTKKDEVVQVIDKETGEKVFYRIPADKRDAIVSKIDNDRSAAGEGGTAGKVIGGRVEHVTARTPEDMAKRGFKDGGVYDDVLDDDVNKLINNAIDEQSGKYGDTLAVRVKNWIGDQVNPYRALAKVDDAYAKANGMDRTKMPAGERLEDLARRSAASEREAATLFEQKLAVKLDDGTTHEASAADLVKKYAGDSDEGMEFNNYTNAKFDLEFRELHKGKRIQNTLDDAQLKKFVDDYEAKNPDAIKDLKTKRAVNDLALDYMVKAGAIGKEEAKQIKAKYKNAVPLERVFPDDLARTEVVGKNVGSIAKQTVIQRLEGGSDIPLSNSFDTMLNRVYKAVSQGNRAKLAQKILERSQEGMVAGSNLVVGAGNKSARIATRDAIREINKGTRYLEKRIQMSNRQMRRISSELNKLNKEGLDASLKKEVEPTLAGKLVDPGIKTSPNETKNIIKSLLREPEANILAIQKKIANREPKLAAKLDEVMNYRAKIEANKAVKTDLKDVIVEFGDDPTTGKQVISGLINGESYKLEVPPDLAKAVMGMESQKLTGVLKAFAIVKKPFEVTWTGVLNPVFSAMSFVFYDTPMSIINSPQGFKTMAPKAVIESIKSINSGSDFQRRLAAEGARPYGGSGASAFIKPDTKSIAAQRNILSSIKHTVSSPEVALSKLDVWGGKLANATRTRVARAEYDAVLKAAKKNGDDITDPAIQKQAMEQATLAYRTIMPDFDTMSNLVRQVNSVVPFFAASTAGMRSFGQALRRDPAGTGAKAMAVGIIPTIGITSFSLMQPAGQEFYAEMEKNSPKTLDDNLVIVLPGAHKDDKTGEWTGIVKIPLAPEFRAINQTAWRSVRGAMGGDGPEASHVALSLFDTVTGGVRSSENPLVSTRRILSGEDPRTGERLVKGDMANLPKEEQIFDSTSEAGKVVGKILNTSPIQGDKLLGQFGLAGQTVRNGGKPAEAIATNVENRLTGAYGERASESFFDVYSPLKARRDQVSKEVTTLVKEGRVGEARRKADEYNETIMGSFADFSEKYGNSDAYDPMYDELMYGLPIRTSKRAFASRDSQ